MILERLEKLVGFYPVSDQQNNVGQLLDYAEQELEKAGFQVTRLEYAGVNSLYAHPTGSKTSKLMLQAHVDVVPGEGQPFKTEGDRILGRGVFDMLFGTACYLEMAAELRDKDISIMLSGDEEVGGFQSVEKFLANGYTTELCILPDAGDGFGRLNIGAKGVYTVKLRINGQSHHGSRPWEGDGAAIKLAHFLTDAETIFDPSDRQNSTMTVAVIGAGDAGNRGPGTATATLDIRYSDKTDLSRIQQSVHELLTKYNGEITQELFGDDYLLDVDNPRVQQFVELYEQIAGQPIEFTKAPGSSDARFFAKYNIPVIMLRPDGGGAHGDAEWLSQSSLDKFYELIKSYVNNLNVVK